MFATQRLKHSVGHSAREFRGDGVHERVGPLAAGKRVHAAVEHEDAAEALLPRPGRDLAHRLDVVAGDPRSGVVSPPTAHRCCGLCNRSGLCYPLRLGQRFLDVHLLDVSLNVAIVEGVCPVRVHCEDVTAQ
jgi:hypothetical protein